jgi:hypothetical protein
MRWAAASTTGWWTLMARAGTPDTARPTGSGFTAPAALTRSTIITASAWLNYRFGGVADARRKERAKDRGPGSWEIRPVTFIKVIRVQPP